MAERPLLHGYTTPPEAVSYASLLGWRHPTALLHHTPEAGIADEEELRKLPQQQQPRLTSSSELPTYTVFGQQLLFRTRAIVRLVSSLNARNPTGLVPEL